MSRRKKSYKVPVHIKRFCANFRYLFAQSEMSRTAVRRHLTTRYGYTIHLDILNAILDGKYVELKAEGIEAVAKLFGYTSSEMMNFDLDKDYTKYF